MAEQLARGIYLELADGLVPFGRRPDDKPVPGWPDAYLIKANRAIIAIEATTAGDARTDHWPADLAKLAARLAPQDRGGLIWVAWCPASTLTDVVEMRNQARLQGLPGEEVHIVFRKELCARLREPFHARFWINDLQLKVTSGPFGRVEDVIRRFNLRRSTGIFPTVEEYEEDRAYAPPLLATVESTLADQHAAIVVGHGAAGKTTLAFVLAHRPRFRHAPTYYLDLTETAADPTLVERAGEAFTAIADRGVLFVIDNAHLDPGAAVRLFEQWETLGGGSELLILTRRIRTKAEVWDDEPELETIPLPCFDLIIEAVDLEGVYRRHFRARTGGESPPVQPEVLARWHELFAGDLVVFSAAVLGLLDRGGEAAALEAADARAFVRRRYLTDPELAPEQSALLDLAAVATVEGLVPVEGFAGDALKACIRHGLVWVESRGFRGAYKLYRLAHPGLGALLRDAAGRTEASRDDRMRVLKDHPFASIATALRLRKNSEVTEAVALLKALWRNSEWPLNGVRVAWWREALIATQELQLITAEEISARVTAWLAQSESRDALVRQALATPLEQLPSFLTYADTAMPAVAKAIRDGLAKDPDALVRQALATPLEQLRSFLTYADTVMPAVAKAIHDGLSKDPDARVRQALAMPLEQLRSFLTYADTAMPAVAKAIHDGLSKDPDALVRPALATQFGSLASFLTYADTAMPAVAKAIRDGLTKDPEARVRQALATPLHYLPSFLTYAGTAMPAIAKAIRDGLAKDPDALVRQALATPLEHLASFLTYADTAMPAVAKAIRDGLAKDPDALVRQALETPLDHLASFLTYADAAMPAVAKAIRDGLAKDPDALVRQALETPLEHLASFLTYADTAIPKVANGLRDALVSDHLLPAMVNRCILDGPGKIVALCRQDKAFIQILPTIDTEAWSRRWANAHLGRPDWFRGFASFCYGAGRGDLVCPIAEAIIRIARAEDFPSPGVTIIHLTFILTSPHRCSPSEVEEFFAQHLPPDWLAAQYSSPHATVGALAGAVRSVAMGERDWLGQHFCNPDLWRRVLVDQPAKGHSPRQIAEWLQLLSAARLLGCDGMDMRPMGCQPVSKASEVLPLGPLNDGIQPMQAGLWAGLREWCHLTRERPVVNAAVGRWHPCTVPGGRSSGPAATGSDERSHDRLARALPGPGMASCC